MTIPYAIAIQVDRILKRKVIVDVDKGCCARFPDPTQAPSHAKSSTLLTLK